MNFWKNPEYNSLKIILAVLVFISAVYFVYKNMQSDSLENTGQVASGISVKIATSPATAITKTSAVLNGKVIDAGITTSRTVGTPVQFDYGTSQKYGMASYAGSATTGQSFYAPVTGLTCGTTYHFRSRASMFASAASGTNMQFTTLACNTPDVKVVLGTATTNTPTAVGSSNATFIGSATNFGGAVGAMGGFEYGTTTSYGNAKTAAQLWSPGSFSLPVTGLSCGTNYYVRSTLVNSAGKAYGPSVSFTTGACPAGPAPTVSTSGSNYSSATGFLLKGMIGNNQGATSGTTGFQYGATTAYGNEIVAGANLVGPFSVSIPKTGLVRGTTYHYRAFFRNNLTGKTGYGADMTFVGQ